MKIYRIWSRDWTSKIEECAFCSSIDSAGNYIRAQLKDAERVAGCLNGHWIDNFNDDFLFKTSLENGYHWGEMNPYNYMSDSYWAEEISVED